MSSRNALTLLPLLLGVAHETVRAPRTVPPSVVSSSSVTRARRGAEATKEFHIPLQSLREWAQKVVVSVEDVTIDGNSGVHPMADDCEIHFGGHSPFFQGDPKGIVLEPMNACLESPPGLGKSWAEFARELKNSKVKAAGVPRIWPEHLLGGSPSNPDHAVELHPLTSLTTEQGVVDLASNIFAGEYRGKDGNRRLVSRVQVTVTASDDDVTIQFLPGSIGNFTTLDLKVNVSSIADDGAGSFRMNAEALTEDGTTAAVRVVTVAGSPMNESMARIRRERRSSKMLEGALVLYSLSPEALVAAAERSAGSPVRVDRPVQLILYGIPESE